VNKSQLKVIALLFNKDQKRKALILFFLFLINMLLEVFSVGLVVPLLSMVIDGDLLNNYIGEFDLFGQSSKDELIIFFAIILILAYLVKTLFSSFYLWFQNNYIYKLQAGISKQLFSGYMRLPYIFHLQHNSAELVRNIIGEVGQFGGLIMSILVLIAEILVVTGVLSLLLFFEPIGTMFIVFLFISAGLLFHSLLKEKLSIWGKIRQQYDSSRIQHVNQGMGGIKDIKVLGKEKAFISRYDKYNVGSSMVNRNFSFAKQLPRLWFELLAVIAIASLVLILVSMGRSTEYIVTILGLFAASTFKLLPSINRIVNSLQHFRYSAPIIDMLVSEFKYINATKLKSNSNKKIIFNKNIKIDNISFSYKGNNNSVLSNMNIEICKGDSIGFMGPSGSGKSTLVDIILGLLEPTSGQILIDGVDIQSNMATWQKHIGYVPQSIYLTDDTIRRNIAFGESDRNINEQSIISVIKKTQLEVFINQLPEGLDTIIGEHGVRLSGGQRQRIGIARALYHEPEILVLDEATSALDINTEEKIINTVMELRNNKTLVIVSHRPSTLKRCDFIYNMEDGKIIESKDFQTIKDDFN
jgi:ABC-type bacteriocin/lantibiotic exporter with double-glycine peptidase domain